MRNDSFLSSCQNKQIKSVSPKFYNLNRSAFLLIRTQQNPLFLVICSNQPSLLLQAVEFKHEISSFHFIIILKFLEIHSFKLLNHNNNILP